MDSDMALVCRAGVEVHMNTAGRFGLSVRLLHVLNGDSGWELRKLRRLREGRRAMGYWCQEGVK